MMMRWSPESIRAAAGSPERGAHDISGEYVLIHIFSDLGVHTGWAHRARLVDQE
jgi:hypothetical protein